MSQKQSNSHKMIIAGSFGAVVALFIIYFTYAYFSPNTVKYSKEELVGKILEPEIIPTRKALDKDVYDQKMLALANRLPVATSTATTTPKVYAWPVKAVYPGDGALLPFTRIIAYYGNFYSTKMGALGEYPPDEMLTRLRKEVRAWEEADPSTPVTPAIHYIVTVAQGTAGADGDWTARMPDSEIEKAITLAKEVNGVVFLDVQAGQSTIQKEVAAILPYLKQPQIHLGIDPEFAMKGSQKPGEYIGTLDASQINDVITMLSQVVEENNLPPKVLVVHRFTEKMVTNYQAIKPTKQVQVVMTMDGWGTPELKIGIYRQVVASEPVQFTGVKLFYKNDLRSPSTRLLTPIEIMTWRPRPSYVQYQ